jgi:hypothetical protein
MAKIKIEVDLGDLSELRETCDSCVPKIEFKIIGFDDAAVRKVSGTNPVILDNFNTLLDRLLDSPVGWSRVMSRKRIVKFFNTLLENGGK